VPDAEVVVAMMANVGDLKGLEEAAREAADVFAQAPGRAASYSPSNGRRAAQSSSPPLRPQSHGSTVGCVGGATHL
jgi:hypothetical protein